MAPTLTIVSNDPPVDNIATNAGSRPVLVEIFLRGGFDMLGLLSPVLPEGQAAPNWLQKRFDLKLTPEVRSPNPPGMSIDLDIAGERADFIKEHWRDVQSEFGIALFPCAGWKQNPPSLSHFDVQAYLDSGSSAIGATSWMGRLADMIGGNGYPVAVSLARRTAGALAGTPWPAVYEIGDPNDPILNLQADGQNSEVPTLINLILKNSSCVGEGEPNQSWDIENFKAYIEKSFFPRKGKVLDIGDDCKNTFRNHINGNSIAKPLLTLLELLYAGAPIQTAAFDFGGWDTHDAQAETFKERLKMVNDGLELFNTLLGRVNGLGDQITLLLVSEFGRRLTPNASGGTDHGEGGLAIVAGREIKSGTYGNFQSSIDERFNQARHDGQENVTEETNFDVATDVRCIRKALVQKQFSLSAEQVNNLFPDFDQDCNFTENTFFKHS